MPSPGRVTILVMLSPSPLRASTRHARHNEKPPALLGAGGLFLRSPNRQSEPFTAPIRALGISLMSRRAFAPPSAARALMRSAVAIFSVMLLSKTSLPTLAGPFAWVHKQQPGRRASQNCSGTVAPDGMARHETRIE